MAVVAVVVLVYLVAAYGVLGRWQSKQWYTPTGDEPHYLVIASAIVHDHTLEVTRAYAREFRTHQFVAGGLAPAGAVPTPANTHALAGPHGLYSVHDVGVPILVAPGLWWRGVSGARETLVLLSALAVGVIAWLARREIRSAPVAALAAGATCVGLPLLAAAGRIYPDVVGGTIAVVVLAAAYSAHRHRWLAFDVAVMALLAYLPWIHIKFALPMAVAGAWLAWRYWQLGQTRRLAVLAAAVVVSLALLGVYNLHAFGHVTGPYVKGESTLAISTSAVMVFFGLLFDRNAGMFVQQPLLLLGFFELCRGCARRQLWAIASMAVFLAFLVPNALHPVLYGGDAFAGRFGWSSAVVLMAPTVVCVGRLYRRHQRVVLGVLSASVVLQGVFAYEYLSSRYDFFNQSPVAWLADYPSLYGPLGRFLPALYSPFWALHYGPNLVAMAGLAVLVLAAVGLSWRMWVPLAVAAVAGYGVAYARSDVVANPVTYTAASLPSTTGAVTGSSRVATSPADPPGFLTYGPYALTLVPGHYALVFAYRSSPQNATVGTWDVLAEDPSGGPSREVATGPLSSRSGSSTQMLRARFTLPAGIRRWDLQIRTFFSGAGHLEVDSLTVLPHA